MGQKSIKKNYIYNLSYQILLVLTQLITIPYVSRVLGTNGVGTYSYAESVLSYFLLFGQMGINIYGQREISYVQDSPQKRSIVFWNTKILGFVSTGLALAAYLVFSLTQRDSTLYLVLGINLLALAIDNYWFFYGIEEIGKIVLRNVIVKTMNIVFIFAFIKDEDDVVLYAFGIALFALLSNISMWGYMPRYLVRISKSDIHPFKDIKVVWSLFIPTIATQIYTYLDKTMIGAITKESCENAYYEQAGKIVKIVLFVVTALGTVMIPRIGYYFEQKRYDEVKNLMYKSYRFTWLLGVPVCLGIIAIAPNFVPWFFGPGYEKVENVLGILAFVILAIGISNVTGMQYLIPTKRQNVYTLTVIIGACTNIVLNVVMICFWKSFGAAIATVIAETVIAVVQLWIVRKEISIINVFKCGIKYYISGVIMYAVLFVITGHMVPSIVNTLILIVVGVLAYFISLFVLRDDFFFENVRTLANKLKKLLRR